MSEDQKKIVIQHIVEFYAIVQKEIVDMFPEEISELSPLLLKVLREIYYTENIMPSILSKRLSITIPNTSRCLHQLTHLGYITKDKDINDRRVTHIKLTGKGIELIQKTTSYMEQLMLKRLSVLELNELDGILEAILSLKELFRKIELLNDYNVIDKKTYN